MLINNPSFGAFKQPHITLLVINYLGVLSVKDKVKDSYKIILKETQVAVSLGVDSAPQVI